MLFWDPTMIIILPGLLIAMYAQFQVQSAYQKYARINSSSGTTGKQVAMQLLADQGIYDVEVEMSKGQLSDHYDPKAKVIRLSPAVYQDTSLASLAIAAHETGHAIQHNEGYLPLNLRSAIAPTVQFASNLALPIFFIGLFFSFTLTKVGIYLFAAVVLFQIVTLPVEFNASRRALAALEGHGFITADEYPGTKKVLSAAALTYVAAVVMSLLQLLRLMAIAGIGRRND
jgi:Zn-dependent membrane protease YugP